MADIIHFSADRKGDRQLLAKINKAAKLLSRKPHDLVRFLLGPKLDEVIAESGIDLHEKPNEDEPNSQRRAG